MGAFQSRTYKPPAGTVADFRFNFGAGLFQTAYNVAVLQYKGDELVKSGLTVESANDISSLISNTIKDCETYASVVANHKKLNLCTGILATVMVATFMGCMTFDLIDKYPFVLIPFVICCILFSMIFFHLIIVKLNQQISVLSVEFVDKMTKEKYPQWTQTYPNINIELNLIGPIFDRDKTDSSKTLQNININEKKRLKKLRKSLNSYTKSTLKLAQIWVYLRLTLKNRKATVLKQKNETLFSTTFGVPRFNPVELPPQSLGAHGKQGRPHSQAARTQTKQVHAGDPDISENDEDTEYSNSSTQTGHGYAAQSHAVMIEDMEGEIIQVASSNGGAILVPVAVDTNGITESEAELEAEPDEDNSNTEPCETVISDMQDETMGKGLKMANNSNHTEYEIIIL